MASGRKGYDEARVQTSRVEEAYYARLFDQVEELEEQIMDMVEQMRRLEEEIKKVLNRLGGEEGLILRMTYLHGEMNSVIAKRLGCSPRRASRLRRM